MRLGCYRLCFEIGAGGMATVFLASVDGRSGVHRYVALKCLHPELARQPDFAAMFFDEACIASQIHHPNVCSVLDYDESDGVRYIAMEYLTGESLSSLRRRLASGLAGWEPAIHAGMVARIIADASEGLHAAHELVDRRGEPSNVVHRDISPDNLVLTHDGCVKVLDFGVSMSCQNRQKTRPGVVKGKVSYLAPEVLKGQRPDRRSDVWGLGVVAWELLTGARLFDGVTDAEALRAISDGEIRPPSEVRKDVPAAIDAIVLTALDRDPDRRQPTARALGTQMTRFLADHRLAIGLGELAEWMDRLFPNGRSASRQLLEVAAQLDDASAVLPLDTSEIMVEEPAREHADPLEATGARRVRPFFRRQPRWLPGLAAAAVAGLLLAGWSWWHEGEERPAAAAVAPAPASAPAPPPAAAGAGTTQGFSLSVSPVEASGNSVLLRVDVTPAAATGAPPVASAAGLQERTLDLGAVEPPDQER